MLLVFNTGVRNEFLPDVRIKLPLHVRPVRIARKELLESEVGLISGQGTILKEIFASQIVLQFAHLQLARVVEVLFLEVCFGLLILLLIVFHILQQFLAQFDVLQPQDLRCFIVEKHVLLVLNYLESLNLRPLTLAELALWIQQVFLDIFSSAARPKLSVELVVVGRHTLRLVEYQGLLLFSLLCEFLIDGFELVDVAVQSLGLGLEFKFWLLFDHHVFLRGGAVQNCQHFSRGAGSLAVETQRNRLFILLVRVVLQVVGVVILDELEHFLFVEEARLTINNLIHKRTLKHQILVVDVGGRVLVLDRHY